MFGKGVFRGCIRSIVNPGFCTEHIRKIQTQRIMAQDKPYALVSVSETGGQGFIPEAVDILKQHFQIITQQEFLQNSSLSSKIQIMFLWDTRPKIGPSLLSSLPALKLIASGGVGIDHVDVPHLNSLGLSVSNTPYVVSNATADMAMGLLLASARRIVEGHLFSIDPTGVPHTLMGVEVSCSTIGIIGMGHIGFKLLKESSEDEQAVGATYCKNMEELLKQADFVVLAVNLTPQTTGLIGHKELSMMKPTATLVNISRGRVVDQDALVEALQKRTIQAAALDVTYPEPLPRDHPLLHLPNIIITPHTGTDTLATTLKMVQTMVDSALAAVKGQQIPNEVKLL
ncbi:hypothetical protein WMY93_019880 [Mugilogobius chulae]|uniref:Glyoxylate reductase/hydroxypyruvate reductase-like n=1 Tax=Mugilogobius chulae TaxID=88201 RepID=A0AAW0NRJ8_9GOBI